MAKGGKYAFEAPTETLPCKDKYQHPREPINIYLELTQELINTCKCASPPKGTRPRAQQRCNVDFRLDRFQRTFGSGVSKIETYQKRNFSDSARLPCLAAKDLKIDVEGQ